MPTSGIIELISLLLGLAGFGIHPDPKPVTADAALAYAIPDPDIVVQLDAAALVPSNYKALLDLPSQPQIAGSPELSAVVRKVIGEVEGGRGLAKQATGIDITADVQDATVFVQLTQRSDPNFLAAVHGKFTTANVDKIASMANHRATPAGAGAWVEMDDKTSVGVTKDHVLLVGTTPWVRDRLADNWKAPSHAAGTTLGYAAAAIDGKPVLAVVLTLSASARQEVVRKLDGTVVLTDLVSRHKAAAFSIYADGAGWSWTDTSKTGLESVASMSDGMVDLLRAAQIAPRGMGKLALGALESYKGDKRVEDLLRHRDELLKVVAMYSSDGQFKVKTDKDPAKLTLTVRATGKTASEVLPLGFLAPLAAFGYFVERGGQVTTQPPQIGYPPPPPVAPRPGPNGKRP